jgi:hypothetical protein
MNTFQWLALLALGLLTAGELSRLRAGAVSRASRLFRVLVWATAAAAIAFPGLVQDVASAIGIGRGADVVLYVFVLTFLATAFYFYSRQVQLQRQVTQLVRHVALSEARRGGRGDGDPRSEGDGPPPER